MHPFSPRPGRKHTAPSQRRGFTLIELSLVLGIIGIIVGMGVVSLQGVRKASLVTQTQNKLDVIEKALLNFRLAHNRLPCPSDISIPNGASNYGAEPSNVSYCNVAVNTFNTDLSPNYYGGRRTVEGGIPVKALGLPDEFMLDGWGRRIAYAVDAAATVADAFEDISPTDSCEISVSDGGGGTRTSGAIYALLSYGENGHGGRTSSGTLVSAGSMNTDELQNCHCDQDGNDVADTVNTPGPDYHATLSYVQKEHTEGDSPNSTFDDIVRFKERWQLRAAEDDTRTYRGPHMAALRGSDSKMYLSTYRNNCGNWVKTEVWADSGGSLSQPSGVDYANGLVFTPNNRHIFVHPACKVLKINGSTLADISGIAFEGGSTPYCSTSMSDDDDYIRSATDGTIVLLRRADGEAYVLKTYNDYFKKMPYLPYSGNLDMSISAKGEYIATNDSSTINIFRRLNNGTYTGLATNHSSYLWPPWGINEVFGGWPGTSTHPKAMAFSPDGKYFAVMNDQSPPTVYLWRIDYGNDWRGNMDALFAPIPSITAGAGVTASEKLSFSGDGQYLIVGSNAGNTLGAYKINPGDSFDAIAFGAGDPVAISSNGRWARSGTTLWRRYTPNNFQQVKDWPAGVVTPLTFSDSATYVVFSH